MAINQFNITFIPRQAVLDRFKELPNKLFIDHDVRQKQLESNDFDVEFDFQDDLTIDWWQDAQTKFSDIEPLISSVLQPIDWTKEYEDFISYGDSNENDVSISLTEKIYIDEFNCRINVAQLDSNFITLILNLANRLDCLIIDRKGNLLLPTFENLIERIKESNAYKFTSNPSDFLNKLSSGEIKPE